MRYLIYIGSPRKEGNSYTLGAEITRQLELKGIAYDILYAPNSLTPCLHCEKCSNTGYCMIQDSWKPYFKQFYSYDSLILVSPIYFYELAPQTLSFLSRFYSCDWDGISVGLVTVSGSDGYRGGHDLVEESVIRSCEYKNSFYAGSYNKVTNDLKLPLSGDDILGINDLLIKMQYSEV